MLNFDFKRSARKCAETQREFERGEVYYSALVESDDELVRLDFSEEVWKGTPEKCVGWWKSRIPELDDGKVYWAPNDVLLGYFQHVIQQPENADEAYVMALLLVRKRILQLIDTHDGDEAATIELLHRKFKTRYDIVVCEISKEKTEEIQSNLANQLFTNQLEADDADSESDADE